MLAKLSRLAVVAVSGIVCAVTIPTSAQADPVAGVTCALGTYSAKFSPAVTPNPQDINVHVAYRFTGCLSVAHPLLRSGAVDYDIFRPNFTCLILADTFITTYAIHWSTGQTSMVSVTGLSVAESTLVTGTVTAGLFTGQPVNIVVQGLTTEPVECFNGGLTSLTGAMALDVI